MTNSQPQTEHAATATMDQPIIVAQDVEKWYGKDFHVLKGISLTVERGEVVVLMGPSGSGKSTSNSHLQRLGTLPKRQHYG